MAKDTDLTVYDAIENSLKGMNAIVSPSLNGKDEISKGVNIDVRNGRVKTRPAFVRQTITNNAGLLPAIENGRYQGGAMYIFAGKDYLVFAVDGRVYILDTEILTVTDVTPPGGLSPNIKRCYFCQANEYLIVQDGINRPIILTGYSSRFSTCGDDPTNPEVPVGTVMVFGQGRLFVVVNKKYFMAGDIYLPWEGDSVLHFTENQYLAGGGAFGLPAYMGNIMGMAFQQNVVSGTGFGALCVFAENGVASFAVQNPRSTWNSTDIARVLYQNTGGTGPDSVIEVGNDIYYMSPTGIESMEVGASQSRANLVVLSLSRKIQCLVDDDTPWAYKYVSGTQHDDRLYFTSIARMRKVDNMYGSRCDDIYFNGLNVVDLANVSDQPMVYDGVWTGCKFLQVFSTWRFGKSQLCFLGLGANNKIGFYTMEYGEYLDNRISQTECRFYTPAMNFGKNAEIVKKFTHADIWLSDIRGIVEMSLYYRPEGYPLWTLAGQTTFMQKDSNTGDYNVYPQIRQKIRLSEDMLGLAPEDSELRNKLAGSQIQFCLSWKGHCQLDRVVFAADLQPDEIRTGDNEGDTTFELTGDALMDYDYVAMEVA